MGLPMFDAHPKSATLQYRWKRTGRCDPKQCGAFCCRVGPLLVRINNTERGLDDRRYYEAMGMRSLGTIKEGKTVVPVLGHHNACSNLQGLRCKIHADRPKICSDFPQNPGQEWYKVALLHGCTYRFKKVKASVGKLQKEKLSKNKNNA